jgi:hypothetical protein
MSRITLANIESRITIANNSLESIDSKFRLEWRSGYGRVGVDYTLTGNLGQGTPEYHASGLLTRPELYNWLGAFIAGLDTASQK